MEAFKWALPMKLLFVCSVVVATSSAAKSSCPYAKLDSGHTMCIFKPRMCAGKRHIKSGGLTCMDKEIILMVHNSLRQNLALGRVKSQPPALNMQTMVWDEELAAVSQRWADQCMPGHDRSRNIKHFTVGQNVAAVWTYERDEGSQPDFPTQIKAWFNEVVEKGFNKDSIEPFRYSKVAGHYTQLAWAETYLVGCGFTYYFDKKFGHTKLYVCNYAPGGNVVGGSMYKEGFPGQKFCSPHGLKPNKRMQGLCERKEDKIDYDNQCAKESKMKDPPKSSMHIKMKEPSLSMRPPPVMMTMRPPMMRMMAPPPPHRNEHHDHHHGDHHPNQISGPHFPNRFMSHGMPMPSRHFDDNRLPPPPQQFPPSSRLPSPLDALGDIFDPFNFFKRLSG